MSDRQLEEALQLITMKLRSMSEEVKIEKILDVRHWYLTNFLSDSARRDRRNSMFLSIVTILYFPLGIKIQQIGPGIHITESHELIPLALLLSASYFTCFFLLKVIGTIKGIWVSSVVKGYLEPISAKLDDYVIEGGGDFELQKLKYLKDNNLYNAYAHINLYEALSFFTHSLELTNGYFFSDRETTKKSEFESEIKGRAHGKPEEYFEPMFRSNVRRCFANSSNASELVLPWFLYIVALCFYLKAAL